MKQLFRPPSGSPGDYNYPSARPAGVGSLGGRVSPSGGGPSAGRRRLPSGRSPPADRDRPGGEREKPPSAPSTSEPELEAGEGGCQA